MAIVQFFAFMIKSAFVHTPQISCALYKDIMCTYGLYLSCAASGCLVIYRFSVYLYNVRVIYPRGIYKHKQ